MPLSITSAPRQLSDGNSAGTVLGQATNNAGLPDNLAFFGATPVPQLLQGSLWKNFGALNVNVVSNSPSSVLANSSSEKSFTVVGVAATDVVVAAIKPTTQAGLLVGSARVSAANTILVTFGNNTAANITPTTTEAYQFVTVPSTLAFTAVTLTPASVAANTTVEQQFTVPGVQVGMVMSVNKPTLNAGVVITNVRAIAANTIGITFANCTAAAVTPTAAEVYQVFGTQGMRPAPLVQVFTAALTPASVAANTTAEQTFTVPGLALGTASGTPNVVVNKPSIQAGLTVAGARVSALNTLAINFANDTATAITPTAAELYSIAMFYTPIPAAGANLATPAVMGVDAGSELSRLGWA
jgi:hypothetical protein